MEWIFIVFIDYNNAEHVENIRFNSKEACETTRDYVFWHTKEKGICVRDLKQSKSI